MPSVRKVNEVKDFERSPSLVGNCEEGEIGERSDGGAKPGPGVGSVIKKGLRSQGVREMWRMGRGKAPKLLNSLDL